MQGEDLFIRRAEVKAPTGAEPQDYTQAIPSVNLLRCLPFERNITYLVGENGSGKSTILEAVAIAAGFNPEGGTLNFRFTSRLSESGLWKRIRLVRGSRRPKTGFFLRTECLFNLATEIERLDAEPAPSPLIIDSYGGRSLHEQSHGEAIMAVLQNRFGAAGLYLLDEPEAALSPSRQLSFLKLLHEHVERLGSQFLIATHSPIVLGYPTGTIYETSAAGLHETSYDNVQNVLLTREFLLNRAQVLTGLLGAKPAKT